jgi:hypothetical protein
VRPVESTSDASWQVYQDDIKRRLQQTRNNNVPDNSLLATSPEEIKRQIEQFREQQERIHIVV